MAEKQKDTGSMPRLPPGALGQIFARDITTAVVICGGTAVANKRSPSCRSTVAGLGIILRCRGWIVILVRFVETPREIMLEMRGLRTLLFPLDGRV